MGTKYGVLTWGNTWFLVPTVGSDFYAYGSIGGSDFYAYGSIGGSDFYAYSRPRYEMVWLSVIVVVMIWMCVVVNPSPTPAFMMQCARCATSLIVIAWCQRSPCDKMLPMWVRRRKLEKVQH